MFIILACAFLFIYHIICLINPSKHKVGVILMSALLGIADAVFGDILNDYYRKK